VLCGVEHTIEIFDLSQHPIFQPASAPVPFPGPVSARTLNINPLRRPLSRLSQAWSSQPSTSRKPPVERPSTKPPIGGSLRVPKYAAPLKAEVKGYLRAIETLSPRTQIRGPVEGRRTRMKSKLSTSSPRTQIRGPVEGKGTGRTPGFISAPLRVPKYAAPLKESD
jgi:hypothetical protein